MSKRSRKRSAHCSGKLVITSGKVAGQVAYRLYQREAQGESDLINIGRLLMLCVWGFLILNLCIPSRAR